jgi:hypothetical protein
LVLLENRTDRRECRMKTTNKVSRAIIGKKHSLFIMAFSVNFIFWARSERL